MEMSSLRTVANDAVSTLSASLAAISASSVESVYLVSNEGALAVSERENSGLMQVARTLSFFWIASLDKPRPVSFSLKVNFTGDAGALARCWGIPATRLEMQLCG